MSPEGWADHCISGVAFSHPPSAFNVIDLGGQEHMANVILEIHCPKKSHSIDLSKHIFVSVLIVKI